MAELLVKAASMSSEDPAKDRMLYKVGDPVVVMPDGHPWGAEEGLPKFWIIKITGATVAQVQAYVDMIRTPPPPEFPNAPPSVVVRRRWRVDTLRMTGQIRNQLQSTGTLTVTFTQFETFLTDKGLV